MAAEHASDGKSQVDEEKHVTEPGDNSGARQ